ncbi:Lipase [Leucobacter sp. 7(1)]|nr:Lipase [Leucobacter sp. 7(1)]
MVLGFTAAVLGCAPAASEAAADLAQNRSGTVQVTNIEIAGPAADRAPAHPNPAPPNPAHPNRVGSERVKLRSYEPAIEAGGRPWATLVWAHGGSFVRGTLDWPEADWVARQFAEAGVRVYSVDYVLASEVVKAPAPANDVAAVLDWAAERAEPDMPLVVGGASAGAHLATVAALDRAVDALLLEYPTLHRVQRPDAAVAAATAGLPEQRRFDAERIAEMYAFYLGEGAADAGATAALVAGELPPERLRGLPPTVMVHADADDLRTSGEQFAEQLRAAGVPVSEAIQPGTVHGYMNRPEESARALADANATIDSFVSELRRVLS